MASVLKQVKLHAQEIVHELMTKLPSIKMGVSKANKILHLFNYLHWIVLNNGFSNLEPMQNIESDHCLLQELTSAVITPHSLSAEHIEIF